MEVDSIGPPASGTAADGPAQRDAPDQPAHALLQQAQPWWRARWVWVLAAQITVVAGFLAAWQLLSGSAREGALLDEFFVGKPLDIWRELREWISDGTAFSASWVTLQEMLIGFLIGSLMGMLVGFLLGVSRSLADVFGPLVYAAYSVPRLALAPMLILWFGLGMESKIALVTLLVFFLTFFNTFAGAREVDQELIDVTRVMRASRLQVYRKVVLPSAVVWVAVGLRISVPYAFVGAIVGEIIAGNSGLGFLIRRTSNQFNPNGMFAAILIAVALSIMINGIVSLGTGHLLRWRKTEQSAGHVAL